MRLFPQIHIKIGISVSRGRHGRQDFELDFFQFAEQCLRHKSPMTRRVYESSLNAFERYLGRRSLPINDITRPMLRGFIESVDAAPKMHFDRRQGTVVPGNKAKARGGASARHIRLLAMVFEQARSRYNDEDRLPLAIPADPFRGLRLKPPVPRGQSSLGVPMMQRIILARSPDRGVQLSLDLFVLSFALMGANLADLAETPCVSGEWWIYKRKKTRLRRADDALMRVRIPTCIRPVLRRLGADQDGSRWLSALHEWESDPERLTAKVNRALTRWARSQGAERFTFYAARHSWATIARSRLCHIEKATIDECLCHSGELRMTDIYAEKDWDLLAEANETVLGLFTWPE